MQRCREVPPDELQKAIDEFNSGDWFECHETLEELWVGEKGELRDFYQGVLQIAVALHHWRNGNFKGAATLLKGGSDCLRRVSQPCQGVDVARLLAETGLFREELLAAGEERMSEVAGGLVPKLHRNA
ncbi:MAG TPA: DUF309 domain-containing protein [Geobacter sp.]|nr:DUF309 domain-containing protein [Geobacter sp.]